MANKLIEYRLRIRNAANTADALEVTSVRGGTNPYLVGVPTGDGASFDPNTGVVTSGSFTVRLVDPITSGTDRLFTSLLEDANGRQQLGHRRAFIEYREDGGAWTNLYSGRISRYTLASDIEWDVTISDFMKAEHEAKAFEPSLDSNIMDFLTLWPNRGCLCGGPVTGGFLQQRDLGGWTMRVKAAPDSGAVTMYRLEPVSVYGPQRWQPGSDIFRNDLHGGGSSAGRINERVGVLATGIAVKQEYSSFTTIRHAYENGARWPGLVTLIDRRDGNGFKPWRPINPATAGIHHDGGGNLISGKPGQLGLCVIQDGQADLTLDSLVTVRVLTVLPSELSPIYFVGHPVDFLANLWLGAGIPYDTTALENVRTLMGWDMQLAYRATQPESIGTLAEQAVYGPFGVAARQGTDGEIEIFTSRLIGSALPSTTITAADVVEGSVEPFHLDTSRAIKRFSMEFETFIPEAVGDNPDGVEVGRRYRYERTNDDPGAIASGEIHYAVPAEVRSVDFAIEARIRDWVDARAYEAFDRFGRGPIAARMTLLRGGAGDSVQLGDEVLVNLPQLPNANKRLGDASVSARCMQVVHVTPTLIGKEVELLDAGPNASPYGTVPTHTIAASAARPRNIAEVTITNAAALNAASAAVRLQMAVVTSGVPGAERYSDVAYFKAGSVPTTAYQLPAVVADSDVYVRARAERKGSRPSAWSTGVGVSLDALDAPTGVTATAHGTDGTRASAAWTIGADATTAVVEVWRSPTASTFASATQIAELPAGSNRFDLYDLTPSTAYRVYIRHRDTETGDVSAEASATVTTGATAATLNAPTHPDGFSTVRETTVRTFGLRPSLLPAYLRYGIVVKATEMPSFVEVQEAVETGVGTGLYGAYATVGTAIPSVAGDWTTWTNVAPNDGLRRKLKARHVRDNATASAYTSEVTVTPGTNDPIPQFPLDNLVLTSLVDSDGRPVDSTQRSRVRVRRSTNLSLTTLVAVDITFDTEDADIGAMHDNASNTHRLTFPTGSNKGFWQVRGHLYVVHSGAPAGSIFTLEMTDSAGVIHDVDHHVTNNEGASYLKVSAMIVAPTAGTWLKLNLTPTFSSGTPYVSSGRLTFFEAFHNF